MFTGIIQTLGRIEYNREGSLGVRANIGRLTQGASVCVNGVCLTITKYAPRSGKPLHGTQSLHFDLSPETLRLTNLGALKTGDSVNIEPSLRASDFIGGHWLSGHVDAKAAIVEMKRLPDSCVRMRVSLPAALKPLVAIKGSIAIDGISLTVTQVGRGWFETILIPHTLKATALSHKKAGDLVNLEADMLARYIYNILKVVK